MRQVYGAEAPREVPCQARDERGLCEGALSRPMLRLIHWTNRRTTSNHAPREARARNQLIAPKVRTPHV